MLIVIRKMENNTNCPNCENRLENHTNEQLQKCALVELSKINKTVGGTTLD